MNGFYFRDLRHTNATLAAASGAPLPTLMARLGHASAAAIRYQHKIEGQDDKTAAFLDHVGRRAESPARAQRLMTRRSTVAADHADSPCITAQASVA